MLGPLGIVVFGAIWELASRTGLVDREFIPPVSTVLHHLGALVGTSSFWDNVGETMRAWAIGLAISVVGGLLLGLAIGVSSTLREITHSTIEFLRPVPSVALIPLAVLLFGVTLSSSLLLIVYASFWYVLLQVLYGVADVDPVADNTARSYGLGAIARVRYVVWPTALPYLMTGIRLASTVALILAITAELVIGNPGLGHQVALAQSASAWVDMYALIIATGLIGVIVNVAVRMIEKRVLHWHPSIRRESVA